MKEKNYKITGKQKNRGKNKMTEIWQNHKMWRLNLLDNKVWNTG